MSLGDRFFEHNFEEDVTALKTGLIAREPVMAHAAAVWLVTQIGALVVGQTHLLTAHDWSGTSQGLVALVSALILGGLGKVLREKVTPAATALLPGVLMTSATGVFTAPAENPPPTKPTPGPGG